MPMFIGDSGILGSTSPQNLEKTKWNVKEGKSEGATVIRKRKNYCQCAKWH